MVEVWFCFGMLSIEIDSVTRSCSENYYNTLRSVTMFNKRSDWTQELMRCGATGWRVLSQERADGIPDGTMPMHYVVPSGIENVKYLKLSEYFRESRGAIWVSFTRVDYVSYCGGVCMTRNQPIDRCTV